MPTLPSGLKLPPDEPRRRVLCDIDDERDRQDEKWGEQNHSDGTGPGMGLTRIWDLQPDEMANLMRHLCEMAALNGHLTWRHILLEEVFEALAEGDPVKLRTELIQSGAVITAWVEAIDRRSQ